MPRHVGQRAVLPRHRHRLSGGALGFYAIALGVLAGGGIVVSNILSEAYEKRLAAGTRIYAGGGGFDFDDLLYLLGPAAWLGWLAPMLIGASSARR